MTGKNKRENARLTLDEYRDRLHDIDGDFLLCKDIRHQWEIETPYTPYHDNNQWYWRVLVCARCGTIRTDSHHLDSTTRRMERGPSTYRYPAGFSTRGLPEARRLNDFLRYESFIRTIADTKNNKEKNNK